LILFGNPVPNALVTLTQGNVEYAKVTDSFGNYYIATESGDPLATGLYSLGSGGTIVNVNVTSGTTYTNVSGVDSGTAQDTSIQDAQIYN
jgi:hypothetical protein